MPHATEPPELPVPTDLGQTRPVSHPFVLRSLSTAYRLGRKVVNNYLCPDPKDYQDVVGGPRIAVIGAGITGVTAAAYLLGYGFNVVIFEKNPRANMGGIWTVSATAAVTHYLYPCSCSIFPASFFACRLHFRTMSRFCSIRTHGRSWVTA